MTDENTVDLTGMVKSFEYSFVQGTLDISAAVDELYFHSLPDPVQTFRFAANIAGIEKIIGGVQNMTITAPGKCWFDWTYTLTGEVQSFEYDALTDRYSYTLKSSSHNFTANQSWLARFLRWVTKRDKVLHGK